jgi:(p)ppGpp synthase/HD superfamily hydrolase
MLLQKNTSPLIIDATVAFIQEAHQGQKYGNMPYFFHPIEVAEEVLFLLTGAAFGYGRPGFESPPNRETAFLAALLHDVVEDTEYTESDLRERYSTEVVDAVMLLTLKEGKDYRDNIQRIIDSGNVNAMLVKLADNRVNRRGDKSGFKPEKAQKLNDRYDMSMEMLLDALAEHGITISVEPVEAVNAT